MLIDTDEAGYAAPGDMVARVSEALARQGAPADMSQGQIVRAILESLAQRYARGLANALINLPQALLLAGQPEAAARLQGFAMAHWLRLYGQPNRIELAEAKRARRLLRCALGPARADRLRLDGEALVLSAAVALALDAGAA